MGSLRLVFCRDLTGIGGGGRLCVAGAIFGGELLQTRLEAQLLRFARRILRKHLVKIVSAFRVSHEPGDLIRSSTVDVMLGDHLTNGLGTLGLLRLGGELGGVEVLHLPRRAAPHPANTGKGGACGGTRTRDAPHKPSNLLCSVFPFCDVGR